jgi:hypothetical protein
LDKRISSIRVLAGKWQFFNHYQFDGDQVVLEPGTYSELEEDWTGEISSFRCLASDQASN